MYEVEVKVVADHDAVREHLPEDAEPRGTVEQVDTYYDAPHRDFTETDEALRLRRERRIDADSGDGDPSADHERSSTDGECTSTDGERSSTDSEWTAAVTYKGPLLEVESKTREEFETTVAEGEELEAALERLGFEPAAEVRKQRERYQIGEFTASLDAVEGLGEYLEVETEIPKSGDGAASDPSIAEPREAALSIVAELGGDPDEQIRTSYLGLILVDDESSGET